MYINRQSVDSISATNYSLRVSKKRGGSSKSKREEGKLAWPGAAVTPINGF